MKITIYLDTNKSFMTVKNELVKTMAKLGTASFIFDKDDKNKDKDKNNN